MNQLAYPYQLPPIETIAPVTFMPAGMVLDIRGDTAIRLPDVHLAPAQRERYDRIMDDTLHEPVVGKILDIFNAADEQATARHGLKVGSLMVAAGTKLGLSDQDLKIAAIGGIGHDLGKTVPHVQQAIHSPYSFEDHPELAADVRSHPAESVAIGRQLKLSANVLKIYGLHHSKQTERAAYGTDDTYLPVPEQDGYVPNLPVIGDLIADADIVDAFTADAYQRGYLQGKVSGKERALQALDSLNTSVTSKQAVAEAAGLITG